MYFIVYSELILYIWKVHWYTLIYSVLRRVLVVKAEQSVITDWWVSPSKAAFLRCVPAKSTTSVLLLLRVLLENVAAKLLVEQRTSWGFSTSNHSRAHYKLCTNVPYYACNISHKRFNQTLQWMFKLLSFYIKSAIRPYLFGVIWKYYKSLDFCTWNVTARYESEVWMMF